VYASFEDPEDRDRGTHRAPYHFNDNWRTDPNRVALLAWLEERCIAFEDCGDFASENGFKSYAGNLYIHVPFDENDQQYRELIEHCELPDGTPRNPLVKLWVVTLESAMTNSHHDEPGFWERWAENF
jgi:hypothetical protein